MKHLILAAFLLLSSSFVQAQTSFRDWKVNQEADAIRGTQVCRAYTTVSRNVPFPVELSLSFPVAFDHPPTMVLKMPANSGVQRAYIPFSSREIEDLLIFQAAADPTGKDLLWYVPIQMEKMVDIIIGNDNLPLKFSIPNKEVLGSLSLSGSSAAMNQIARCLRANDILPTKFFKELNTDAGTAPLGTQQTVQQLMKYVDQAFGNFQGMAKSQSDLEKLRAAMRTLVQQETAAQTALNSAQANLDRAINAAATTADRIRQGEERLQLIPGEIQTLQNQKGAADQLLAQKKGIYDPLYNQSRSYRDAIESADSRVDDAASAIRSRENLISNNNTKINELNREVSRLNSEIGDLRSEIQQLDRRKSELEVSLASFSVELEKKKILDNNWSYRNTKDRLEQLRRDERQKHGEMQFAQGRLQRAEQNLRQCLSTPNPQCASQQQERDEAQRQVDSLRNEIDSIRSQVQSYETQVRQYEDQAEREAITARERIANELRQVAGQVTDKRNEMDRLDDRVDRIQRTEIPNLQSEISRAQGELGGLRRDLSQAQSDLARAQSDYANWKRSNDFDRIEREYLAAKKAVDDIASSIASKQAEQTQITRALPGWRTQLTQQQAEITRLTPVRDNAKSKLDGIQQQLAPQRAQEKTLVDGIAALKVQYDENRKLYQTLAKVLLGP